MKNILILIPILLFHLVSTAQSAPPTTMHRIQDTTKNKSGLYYGKSTEGHFSVLLPIPFNDFTMKSEDATSYWIGGKSKEGIKFSVIEIVKKEKNKATDLEAIVKKFISSGSTVQNIKRVNIKNNESISFSVSDKSAGAMFKYVDAGNSLFSMTIEFPVEYKKTIEKNYKYFFSSLTITNQ